MARYSQKQKAALDALMKDDVYRHSLEVITTEGIGNLTMERLAGLVGVSRGTLYNYFEDKDAVVDFVEERAFGPVLSSINEVAASEIPVEDKLQRIAHWIFTAVYDDSALVLALAPTKHLAGNHSRQLERKKRVLRVIEEVVREGIATGALRKLSPVVVAEMFVGVISGMIESMSASGEFYRADAIVPTMMQIFLGGLRTTG